MKKIITIVCIVVSLFFCAACENQNDARPTLPPTDENGNSIEYSEKGKSVKIKNLPCVVEYNGSEIELESIEMYESYSKETCSYFLYSVVAFNVSNLTDEEVHWLQDEDAKAFMLYNNNDENGESDFCHMEKLGSLYLKDTHELFYAFAPSYYTAYRDSFAEKSCSFSFRVKQEETYAYDKETDLNKEYYYSYLFSIPSEMEDSEAIPRPLYDYMVKWLEP